MEGDVDRRSWNLFAIPVTLPCYFRADSFEYLTIWFVFFLLVMLCTFRRESCFYARVQPDMRIEIYTDRFSVHLRHLTQTVTVYLVLDIM